ncbi:MAG TPA: phosphatase PAP2 family protein [Bacteroidales bacterium]|nr:phosphatase PAP2 family protein [Bacteroidales bacterium]
MKAKKVLLILVSLIALLAAALLAWSQLDIVLLKDINAGRERQLDPLFLAITSTAGPFAFGIPVVMLIVALVRKDTLLRLASWYVMISVVLAVAVTNLLKYTINRPRPFETYSFIEKLTSGGSPSFPSGHTSDAFVLAMALSLAFRRRWVVLLSFAWALTMGYTRMGLGVHYPADVLVGAVVGITSAFVVYELTRDRLLPGKLPDREHPN